jgi:hypothetical protein
VRARGFQNEELLSELKDKFWRITTKHGGKRAPAVMAVAHNLLRFVFQVLSTGKPYQAKSATPLEPQRERMIRHHIRRLGKLGVPVGQRGPAPLRPRRRTAAAKLKAPPRLPQVPDPKRGGAVGVFGRTQFGILTRLFTTTCQGQRGK